jgi:hypothetical protein
MPTSNGREASSSAEGREVQLQVRWTNEIRDGRCETKGTFIFSLYVKPCVKNSSEIRFLHPIKEFPTEFQNGLPLV